MNKIKKFYNDNYISINKICVLTIIFLVIFVFFKYLFTLFIPFILGYIISIVLRPIRNIFYKKLKLPYGPSSIISIILLISFIALLGTTIFKVIKYQFLDLYSNIDIYITNIEIVSIRISGFLNEVFFLIPQGLTDDFRNLIKNLIPSLVDGIGKIATSASLTVVKSVPKILTYIFFGFLSSFFFLRDNEIIKKAINENIPKSFLNNLAIIKKSLNNALGGYIRAQLILMSITGTLAIIYLSIFRYPYGLLAGIVLALIDALPFFGSGFILWPWSIYYLFSGEITKGLFLLLLYILIQLNRQIWEPRIVGNQIGLHPLITLMSIFIGASLLGVFGLIFGPITVVIIRGIWRSEIGSKKLLL
ncbi:MAG: sporulation integral membrane protein YtvI [Lachnospirales bacterium]